MFSRYFNYLATLMRLNDLFFELLHNIEAFEYLFSGMQLFLKGDRYKTAMIKCLIHGLVNHGVSTHRKY